jgi:hypothetical protein
MGRPVKNGLDYFPLDIDFFTDEKIQYISVLFGDTGEATIIKLLCKIYRNGYFIKWNQDAAIMFAKSAGNGISVEKVSAIVLELLKRGFFSEVKFKKYGILTSAGIQKRYQRIMMILRRKPPIIDTYIISSEDLPKNDVGKYTKEKKEKEKKLNEREGNTPSDKKHFYDCDPKAATRELLEKLT